jgi:hypothetical protein
MLRVLQSPGLTHDHRVHELEVAGVGREGHGDAAPIPKGVVGLRSVVVLHVPGPGYVQGATAVSLELGQHVLVWDIQRMGENVEAASMRHSQDDPASSAVGHLFQRQIQHGHHHVGALQGKALLAQVGPMQELLEALDFREPLEEPDLLGPIQLPGVLPGLHLRPEPPHALRVLDVLELETDVARVGLAQPLQDLREGLAFLGAVHHHRPRDAGELLHAGAEERRIQLRVPRGWGSQGIDLREHVPVIPIRLNERRRASHHGKEGFQVPDLVPVVGGNRSRSRGFGSGGGRSRGTISGDPFGQQEPRCLGRSGPLREELTPLLGDGLGVPGVLLVEQLGVGSVLLVEKGVTHGRIDPPEGAGRRGITREP